MQVNHVMLLQNLVLQWQHQLQQVFFPFFSSSSFSFSMFLFIYLGVAALITQYFTDSKFWKSLCGNTTLRTCNQGKSFNFIKIN